MLNFLNYNFQINSQNCNESSIFVALETGQRSGTEFTKNAIENGAKAVISQKPIPFLKQIKAENFNDEIANILVKDSLVFIQNLAREKFRFLENKGTKTIGITGSVGKTTTKEALFQTLSLHGKTFATQGNLNNHIGVPLTVLNAPHELDFLVLEMGMNHTNEIEFLTTIAPCKWNLITNVRESHSENFPDGKEGVLKAKFEILSSGGKCFVLKETGERFKKNEFLCKKYPNAKIIEINPQINAYFDGTETTFKFQNTNFKINGLYSNQQCEMLSLAICLMEDVTGKKIEEIKLLAIKGRGVITTWRGKKIMNESYNASPSSMKNALENFTKLQGRKLAILGEMREIEDWENQHKELAPWFYKFDAIFTIGKGFAEIKTKNSTHFNNYEELKAFLQTQPLEFDCILVKASNGVGLWKLFDEFFV